MARLSTREAKACSVGALEDKLPLEESELSGEREVVVKSSNEGHQTVIKDNFNEANAGRCLLDRWTGEPKFKLSSKRPASVKRIRSGHQESTAKSSDSPGPFGGQPASSSETPNPVPQQQPEHGLQKAAAKSTDSPGRNGPQLEVLATSYPALLFLEHLLL